MNKFLLFTAILIVGIYGCKKDPVIPVEETVNIPNTNTASYLTHLTPSPQRIGNASNGYDYLIEGDYVNNGIPYSAFIVGYGTDNTNVLNRSGNNANLSYEFTEVLAPNGVNVVAPNCLQCHAGYLDGEFIMGLGNSLQDFTADRSQLIPSVDAGMNLLYPQPSKEWDAYEPFRKAILAIGPKTLTASVGANPADLYAAILGAHRDKTTLEWSETPLMNIPNYVVPTDVPAWWIMKKKNAMLYSGLGTGDFSRIMMASSLLTLVDSSRARVVDEHFADVLAFILSIEAPAYKKEIDYELASKGEEIFIANCARCHGEYGPNGYYPNFLVDIDEVKTDPVLIEAYTQFPEFINWYNNSWFAQDKNGAKLVARNGYVAPPLDGVWATAPYLHNGSVPTLYNLLQSNTRPTYWKRNGENTDYDHKNMGWNYTVENGKTDALTYDATLLGYNNSGHTYGDHLTKSQVMRLIEYLKTL